MSGCRPLIKGFFRRCADRGCGHVFGLVRGQLDPLALMLWRSTRWRASLSRSSNRRCQSNGGSSTCNESVISRAAIYAARARHSAKAAAHDAPGVCVDHECDVNEAGPGRDIGEIRDPKRVRPGRPELAVDMIQRTRRSLVADRGFDRFAADHAAGPCSASVAPRCIGRCPRPRGAVAARPCARRRGRRSPRRHA